MVNCRFTVSIHVLCLLASKRREPLTSEYIAGSVNTNPVVIRRLLGWTGLPLLNALAGAFAPQDKLAVRAPRPVTGRYVLIWFTRVPPAEGQGTGVYQGGLKSVVVTG